MQQVADGIGNPSLDSNPGSLRVIQSRYLEGLLPLRIIEGHKKVHFLVSLRVIQKGVSFRGILTFIVIIIDYPCTNGYTVLERVGMWY